MLVVCDGGVMQLTPAPEWGWADWNGQHELRGSGTQLQMSAPSRPTVTEQDILAIMDCTVGKGYRPTAGFDVLGTLGTILFEITENTTSNSIEVSGYRPIVETTTGRFSIVVSAPASNAQSGTTDPVLVKNGSWSIIEAGQANLDSE